MHRFIGSKTKSMTFASLNALIADASATGTIPDPRGESLRITGMFAIMAVVMYFLMIRPQQKRTKQMAAMVKAIKSGDKILTSGGIIGVVVSVKDKTLSIRSADTKLEILKSAVSEVTEKSSNATES